MNNILDIQNDLENLWSIFDPSNHNVEISNYIQAIHWATSAVEKMISLLANEHGFEYEDGRILNKEIYPYSDKKIILPFSLVSEGYFNDMPQEIVNYVKEISLYKGSFSEKIEIPYEEAVVFAGTFDCFVSWFLVNTKALQHNDNPDFKKVNCRFRSFKDVLTVQYKSKDNRISKLEIVSTVPQATEAAETGSNKNAVLEKILSNLSILVPMMSQMNDGMAQLITSVNLLHEKLDNITKQIGNYQSLLVKQLDIAVNQDEMDRILSAYTDECTKKIVEQLNINTATNAYLTEENKLIYSIGEGNWNKLDHNSQDFLITAKLSYSNLINMHDVIDYSGVCLLVTKAVEVEMSNRFCRDFLSFLREKYPGKDNYNQYPSSLLRYQKPIRTKDFTLGTVAYTLCYTFESDLLPEQKNNNKDKLMEFVSARLMQGKDEKTINDRIRLIAEGIENIRLKYRNPSAHTNRLQRIDAEECFNLVLDVEKLLKIIMECLDY